MARIQKAKESQKLIPWRAHNGGKKSVLSKGIKKKK